MAGRNIAGGVAFGVVLAVALVAVGVAVAGGVVVDGTSIEEESTDVDVMVLEQEPITGQTFNVTLSTSAVNVAGYLAVIEYDAGEIKPTGNAEGVDMGDPIVNVDEDDERVNVTTAQATGVDQPTFARIEFEFVDADPDRAETDLVLDGEMSSMNNPDVGGDSDIPFDPVGTTIGTPDTTISGTVTAPDDDPIGGVVVSARSETVDSTYLTTSTTDGSYVVSVISDSEYVLTAEKDGYGTEIDSLDLDRDVSENDVDFELDDEGFIDGTVVDNQSDEVVEAATIRALAILADDPIVDPQTVEVDRTETDHGGTFQLESLSGTDVYTVNVTAQGYADVELTDIDDVESGETHSVGEIRIDRDVYFEVVDVDVPEQAEVGLQWDAQIEVRNNGTVNGTAPVWLTIDGESVDADEETTIAAGETEVIELSHVPEDAGELDVSVQTWSDESEPVNLTVVPKSVVEGEVIDSTDSEPIADVDVSVVNDHTSPIPTTYWSGTTDDEGTYAASLNSGEYDVVFEAPGYNQTVVEALNVSAPENDTVDAALERGVFYVVADPGVPESVEINDSLEVDATIANDGSYADQYDVELFVDDESVDIHRDADIDPGDNETIEFDSVPITDESLVGETLTVTVETHVESIETDVTVIGTGGIAATVLDGDGDDDPVEDATVVAEHTDTGATFSNTTDADGVVTITGLNSGVYDLSVNATGYVDWPSDPFLETVEVDAPNVTEYGSIHLERAAFYVVEEFDAPAEAEPGDTITIDATILNDGGESGDRDDPINFTVDGGLVDGDGVELDPGENETFTFEYEIDDSIEDGPLNLSIVTLVDERTHVVSVEADDSGTPPPPPPPPPTDPASFDVDLSLDTDEIVSGESVTVSVIVENVGGEADSHLVELLRDGDIVATETVFLEPGESTTVTFSESLDVPGTSIFSMTDESIELTVEVVEEPSDDEDDDHDGIDDGDVDDDPAEDVDDTGDDVADDGGERTDDTDDSDDVPGFGLLAAAIVVGALALAGTRLTASSD